MEAASTASPSDRDWLREHLAELRERWAHLPAGLPWCVVHGDAWVGNVVATDDGEVVLLDLERTSLGPPEWDTVHTAIKYSSFAQITAAQYRAFCDVYGRRTRSGRTRAGSPTRVRVWSCPARCTASHTRSPRCPAARRDSRSAPGARRADQPGTFRAGGPSRPEARTPAGCSPDVDPLSASGLRHRGRRSVPAQHGTTPQTGRSRPHRSRRHEITYSATPLDVCVLKGHASSELVSSCAMVYRRRAHPTP